METQRVQQKEQAYPSKPEEPVRFPKHEEVCKCVAFSAPCAFTSTQGYPVSYYRIMSYDQATGLTNDDLTAWSRAVYEYVSVWCNEESSRTGRLLGHYQIIDCEDLSMWEMSKSASKLKAKAALSAMNYYVEMGYKVYVINTTSLFGTLWAIVQALLSPRAVAKVSCTTARQGLPDELITVLGPDGKERLSAVMAAAKAGTPVPILRPAPA